MSVLETMAESALADASFYTSQYEQHYSHTLTSRPVPLPTPYHNGISTIASDLSTLPSELRTQIYTYLFSTLRIAVTSSTGCYCATSTTGRYHAPEKWLLSVSTASSIRIDAQRALTALALWEIHCPAAFDSFVARMRLLNVLHLVRRVRINVFETPSPPTPELHVCTGLREVTFSPWQKSWTIDVPAKEGSGELTDERVLARLMTNLKGKKEYAVVMDVVDRRERWKDREWTVGFVFAVRYLLPGKVLPYRWQLKVRLAI